MRVDAGLCVKHTNAFEQACIHASSPSISLMILEKTTKDVTV